MKKKRKQIFIFGVLATALVFLVAVFVWWQKAIQPASKIETSPAAIFVIKKGEGLNSVAGRLDQEGLINSALVFRIWVSAKGLAGQIQAGDFRLKPSFSLEEIGKILVHGKLDTWLTFPEGWRREEFSRRLVANLQNFDGQEFIELTESQEGYLFPDTYLIPQDASASAVIKILSNNFEVKFNSVFEKKADASGLTKKQAITLASIVEREAGQDEDRPLIAGILIKRWRNDWPLQTDATVQYVFGSKRCLSEGDKCDYWKPVSKADLKVESSYNTYLHKGLPPAPICNPGLASIKAVVYPESSDYWFYLSDPSGKTHYAQTAEGHNRNINQYLR